MACLFRLFTAKSIYRTLYQAFGMSVDQGLNEYLMKILIIFIIQSFSIGVIGNLEPKWILNILIGLWLMFCLVISKSYQGSLTSSLAVKYLPTPFESAQDLFDHPSITIAAESNTMTHQAILVHYI